MRALDVLVLLVTDMVQSASKTMPDRPWLNQTAVMRWKEESPVFPVSRMVGFLST